MARTWPEGNLKVGAGLMAEALKAALTRLDGMERVTRIELA